MRDWLIAQETKGEQASFATSKV